MRTKLKRVEYVKKFLPYHEQEFLKRFQIIFIDETGFNLDKQGYKYGWSKKNKPIVQQVPIKITNTSLCTAINKDGVVAYQIFNSSMKSNDFLGFMSNLVNCLKLGRNTSFDKIPLLEVFNNSNVQKEQVSIPVNQREVVFIMDNARIHVAKLVKKKLLQNYNILFLAPYSPYLNIIELWFSQLKKQACQNYYKNQDQLIKGVLNTIKQSKPQYFNRIYKRLSRVLLKAFQL